MPVDDENEEPIAISALQHAVYCLRQCALIHLERAWSENRLTAEGRVMHERTDEPGRRSSQGVRRVSALPLAARRLGIAGVADLVEFRRSPTGEIPYPVEFKRGKKKPHRADEAQLCAQALCLEEMTGASIPEGALFYGETRRRVVVVFDRELRDLTLATIEAVKALFASGRTPAAIYEAGKCRACSLIDLCAPKIGARSAAAWRDREVRRALANAAEDAPP